MATPTTSNSYVGDGSTVLYSFTFPYIERPDVNVSIDEVATTEYSFANATTIQLDAAPANGAAVRIFRSTDNSALKAAFFPGSAIRSRDLNDNFTQTLYVVQEATITSVDANVAAEAAQIAATQAQAAAVTAQQEATEASDDATAAEASASAALTAAQQAQDAANNIDVDVDAIAADAAQAASDAQQAQTAAADAQQAAQDAADAVAAGPVASVNGKQGIVVLELTDLSDVDTSSAGHIPADGQSLVWNQSMGHWMPADASLIIGSLPLLP